MWNPGWWLHGLRPSDLLNGRILAHPCSRVERRVHHPGLWRLAALADPFGNGFDLFKGPDAVEPGGEG
jgi:hypothetical protein